MIRRAVARRVHHDIAQAEQFAAGGERERARFVLAAAADDLRTHPLDTRYWHQDLDRLLELEARIGAARMKLGLL